MEELRNGIRIGIIGAGEKGNRYSVVDIMRLAESGIKVVSLNKVLENEEILTKAEEDGISLDDIKDAIVVGPGYIDPVIRENLISEMINNVKDLTPPPVPELTINGMYPDNREGRRMAAKTGKKLNKTW